MKIKIKMILFFIMVLFTQVPAQAKSFRHSFAPKYLSTYVEKRVKAIEESFVASEEGSSTMVKSIEGGQEGWYFSRFKIRIDPFVEFEVPFAALKIFPIVELDWVRKAPYGWREYRPKTP